MKNKIDNDMRPKIKNHRKGVVGHDGNGMVGGRWESATRLAYKDVPVTSLTECISDEDKAEKCLKWLTEKVGETFRVEAYFDCGYDHSVGLGSYCEINEWFEPDEEVTDAIDSCPWLTTEDKIEMTSHLDDICADEEGYELYDLDD